MLGKISKSVVDKLEPGSLVWDTALVGFGVRRQLQHPHYVVRYRHNGKQKLLTIGRHGSWTPDTARKEALRVLGIVASGVDPSAPQQVESDETFLTVARRYLETKQSALKPRTFANVMFHLTKQSAPLHSLSFGAVTRREVAELLGEVERNSGPTARNRLRASLSALWSWAISEGLCDANAISATAKAIEAPSRERILTADEIRSLPTEPKVFGDILLLLLLTGQRREEIGRLEWKEVDFAAGTITLPPFRTKNNRQHIIPLSHQAVAILQRQDKSGTYVFGQRGFQNWGRDCLRLKGYRPHDLRRTCATGLAELGIMPHIIECVLNHVSGFKSGVTSIYNRHNYLEEMRNALQKWEDKLDEIMRQG